MAGRMEERARAPGLEAATPAPLPGEDTRDRPEAILQFRAMIEHSPDAICLFDSAGVIRFANASTRGILGYEPATLFGADGWKFIHPDDRSMMGATQAEIHARPGMAVQTPPWRALHRDGSWRWIEAVAINLLDVPEVRAVMASYRDVTVRVKVEEQLRQSQKMEAIGLLAGGVAHDFNNLLTVILAAAENADRMLDESHPARDDLLHISKAAQSASELTRKLLTFARRQVRVTAPFDLRDTILGFGGLLRRIMGEDVIVETDATEPLPIEGDAAQLQQLLLNLATNARQAMPGGGTLRVVARRLPVAAGEAPRCQIEVSDTGQGMDDLTRQRVFEPFFTTRTTGTGLGMPVVLAVVQDHRGSIDLLSAPGRGTTVRVQLPLRPGPLPAAPSDPREKLGGTETVLLVEDEPLLRDLLARSLRGLGYTVLTAGDGEEALAIFSQAQDRIAVVVMDVVMPRLGGKDAFSRMSELRPGLRAVLITGYAPEAGDVAELIARGEVSLLAKPFIAPELAAKVRQLLDR